MNKEELRKALKSYRNWTRLSYSSLGRVFEVHRTTVEKIVNGKLQPSQKLHYKIEKIVKIDISKPGK